MLNIEYLSTASSENSPPAEFLLSNTAIARARQRINRFLDQGDPLRPEINAALDAIDAHVLSFQDVVDRLQAIDARIDEQRVRPGRTFIETARRERAAHHRAWKDSTKQQRRVDRNAVRAEQLKARENAETERLKRLEAGRQEGIAAGEREAAESSAKQVAQREALRREAIERKAARERREQNRLREFVSRLKRAPLALNGA